MKYGEPWRIEASRDFLEIVSQDGKATGLAADLPIGREAADRVLACVNACVGVSTEELTKIADWKGSIANHEGAAAANLLVALGWRVLEPDGSEWT